MVKVGVTLPQFRHEADTALAAARQAEELGLDGVFVFDHLWPMGSPDRPIISAAPVLGALAAPPPASPSAPWSCASAWCPTSCWSTSSGRWPTSATGG